MGCVTCGVSIALATTSLPLQEADDTLSVEELGLEDELVDVELLGSQGAESWKDTISGEDNGSASPLSQSLMVLTIPA